MLPTFVISLPDCTERRNAISGRLDELGIQFEWVDAVDGRNGLPAECESLIDRVNGVDHDGLPLLDPEFGCALSHIAACRQVVDREIRYALILEDDAIPQEGLPDYLSGKFWADSDMTSLHYGRAWVRRRHAKPTIDGHTSYPVLPGIYLTSCAGYIVSLRAARHIIERAFPVRQIADWPSYTDQFKREGRWRVVHPRLVQHAPREDNAQSSIIHEFGRSAKKRKVRRILGVRAPPAKVAAQRWARGVFGPLIGWKRIKR